MKEKPTWIHIKYLSIYNDHYEKTERKSLCNLKYKYNKHIARSRNRTNLMFSSINPLI